MSDRAEPAVAGPPRGAPAWIDATMGRAAAGAFGAASYVRAKRSLHPDGNAFHATLTIDAHDGVGARLLDVPGEHRCVVRLSRAIGLPHRVRDIVGLAIRVLDDDGKGRQDLLFSSVWGDGPVSRHVLAPTGSFTGRPLSTILPYQTSDRRMTLLANGRGRGAVHSLDTVAEMFADGQLTFDLRAVSRGRAPVSFARLRGTAALPADQGEALRFNPYHCEPDLEPAGLLNALRRRAYAASQGGRAHR